MINNPLTIDQGIGAVDINGFLVTDFTCASLGNLTIHGVGTQPPGAPNIAVLGDYSGLMEVHQEWMQILNIAGTVSGTVNVTADLLVSLVTGPLAGHVSIGGVLHVFGVNIASIGQGAEFTTGTLDGALSVPGVVGGTIHVIGNTQFSGEINVGTVAAGGAMRVDGLVSVPITVGSLAGELRMGILDGALVTINDPDVTTGRVTIDANCNGDIEFRGGLGGELSIAGYCRGYVFVGAYGAPPADLTGAISIGDLQKEVHISGDLRDPTDPGEPNPDMHGGHIILGQFYRPPAPPGEPDFPALVWIRGAMAGPRPFIAVRYQVPPFHGVWDPDRAKVRFGPTEPYTVYLENTPSMRIWEICACRGDMNNSYIRSQPSVPPVTFDDINVFVQAMTEIEAYSLAYAQRRGTRRREAGAGTATATATACMISTTSTASRL